MDNDAKGEVRRPDKLSKCTWKLKDSKSPHTTRNFQHDRKKILPDILCSIGLTPLVRLDRIKKSYGIKCELLAKCEFMNPGGSFKDRVALRMIEDAEEKGILKAGSTIIEPTSGNTGIGLAMAAAVKGYRCVIVMPQRMSDEKLFTLQALGAEIVRTPSVSVWSDPAGYILTSQRLQKQIPNSVILDQYTNASNPLAHYDQTASEIWEQCDGKIDYLVAGAGTGGTLTGIGRRLKELSPQTKIVAADPEGSTLAQPPALNVPPRKFEVEGIGHSDFVPTALDREIVDEWIKTNDKETFEVARKLIKEEGLLCGGSSGAALSAALAVAKELPAEKRVVVVLVDGIRNYLTRFVSDLWMESKNFLEPPRPIENNKSWWDLPTSCISFNQPLTLPNHISCQEAVSIMQQNAVSQLPMINDDQTIKGFVSLDKLLNSLISGELSYEDSANKILIQDYVKIFNEASLGKLSRLFLKHSFVAVCDRKDALVGVLTQTDLFNFISHRREYNMKKS